MAIHVAITRKVLPGKEEKFKDALRRFFGDSFLHGGVHGAAMMTALPGSESREIEILRTFADQTERDAFYNSKLFKDWKAYASTLTEEPIYRELTGLEAWFRSPVPPPRWKMAVATLCGVISYQPVPNLCTCPAHSGAPFCIQDVDCVWMHGRVADMGCYAAGYEGAETLAFWAVAK